MATFIQYIFNLRVLNQKPPWSNSLHFVSVDAAKALNASIRKDGLTPNVRSMKQNKVRRFICIGIQNQESFFHTQCNVKQRRWLDNTGTCSFPREMTSLHGKPQPGTELRPLTNFVPSYVAHHTTSKNDCK